jgi:hypothetical protein
LAALVREGCCMDQNIARLNIEHFRKLLIVERDETKLQTILGLLREEEDKLAALMSSRKKTGSN